MTKTKQPTAPGLRYLGGFYIHGVPARDLTADEAQQYGAAIQEQQSLTGIIIYEPVATLDVLPDAAPVEDELPNP